MLLLSTLLSLCFSFEENVAPTYPLNGNWGLTQTELFEDGDLKGNAISEEITTFYHFENKVLIISEDGQEGSYNYTLNASQKQLIIDETNTYTIAHLNERELVFYKDYHPYRSTYTFQKVD